MRLIKVKLPAMGEGVFEATITQWMVSVGDKVKEDDSLVEIATDKVDSEVPAPISGLIKEILVQADEVAKVGQDLLVIQADVENNEESVQEGIISVDTKAESAEYQTEKVELNYDSQKPSIPFKLANGQFLSPLVRRIADKEEISINELNELVGTGINGRITKDDVLRYINVSVSSNVKAVKPDTHIVNSSESVEIIEMSRMRSMIAENMVKSKQVAPHVTSFHEVDVTSIVKWRDQNKASFQKKYGQKLTFTPIFIEAVALAIREYPLINVSVVNKQIHKKNNVNIGMATALPDGNLIVPVIKNADSLSLSGLATQVNDLSQRARTKKLKPDDIQSGTFTITNVGSFGNLSGTPIINQPEVAILAIGAIKKRPAVIETENGDLIGIRSQMILSISYDHRVVDGSLGGMFLKKVADILENFNQKREV